MQRRRPPEPHIPRRRRGAARTVTVSLCVPALLAVLAGCTPEPDLHTPAAASTDTVPTPHWTDPPDRPGEVTRSIFDIERGDFTAQVEGPLKAGDLAVEASCTARSDAEMTYKLEGAGGTVFGPPGRVQCNHSVEITDFSSGGVPEGELIQVLLEPGAGVTKGYAILLHH